jgi:hypothetical protein
MLDFIRNRGLIIALGALAAVMIFFGVKDCGGELRIKGDTIQGDGFSLGLPDGFIDAQEHSEFDGAAIASLTRRRGGVLAVGQKGEKLYSTVAIMPMGSTEEINLDEEQCRQVVGSMRSHLASKGGSLGLSGRVETDGPDVPGTLPETVCTAGISVGDEFYTVAALFEKNQVAYAVSCEADSKADAQQMCEHVFDGLAQ